MEVENPVSRAVVQGDSTIITFDDFESTMMAMPTSYGANYYGNTGSYAQVKQIKDPSGIFESSINVIGGSTAFYMAVWLFLNGTIGRILVMVPILPVLELAIGGIHITIR